MKEFLHYNIGVVLNCSIILFDYSLFCVMCHFKFFVFPFIATNGPLLTEQPKSPIGSFVRGVLRSSLGPGEKKRPAVLKQVIS